MYAHITYGPGVRETKQFTTTAEANHFFRRAGWASHKADTWVDDAHVSLPPFVAIPRLGTGSIAGTLKTDLGQPLRVCVMTTRVDQIIGEFCAFYFWSDEFSIPEYDYDPLLSFISPPGMKIGAIGAWPSVPVALLAAEQFCQNLLEEYGHECFRKLFDAYLRRELRAVNSRYVIGVDLAAPGSIDRSANGGVGQAAAIGS